MEKKSISLKNDLSETEMMELNRIRELRKLRKSSFTIRVAALAMIEEAFLRPGTRIATPEFSNSAYERDSRRLVDAVRAELERMNAIQFVPPYGLGHLYLIVLPNNDGPSRYRFAAIRSYFCGDEIAA